MPLSTTQQQQLAQFLRQRLQIIADHAFRDSDPEGHLEALKNVSQQIDTCAYQWRQHLPAMMRHYLSNASYQKALSWLEEQEQASQESTN